jgi:transposase
VVEERAAYREDAGAVDPAGLIFLDEGGVSTDMTRRHARAPRGERACGSAPGGWRGLTLLGALGADGLVGAMTIGAATSAAVFLALLEQVLLPRLALVRPGATLAMDDLRAHEAEAVRERVEAAGFRLRHLPRHSPDLSPIEPRWSKTKTALRAKEARSIADPDRELPGTLATITAADARGRFRRCGYAAPN